MKSEYINHSSGTINSKCGTPAELFYPKHQRGFLSTVAPLGTEAVIAYELPALNCRPCEDLIG